MEVDDAVHVRDRHLDTAREVDDEDVILGQMTNLVSVYKFLPAIEVVQIGFVGCLVRRLERGGESGKCWFGGGCADGRLCSWLRWEDVGELAGFILSWRGAG